jgi:hypothetical protein
VAEASQTQEKGLKARKNRNLIQMSSFIDPLNKNSYYRKLIPIFIKSVSREALVLEKLLL